MTKRQKLYSSIVGLGITLFSIVLSSTGLKGSSLFALKRGATTNYSVNLNESNKYVTGRVTQQIVTSGGVNSVEFAYYNCTSGNGGHAVIGNEGTIKNTNAILSINSINAVFTCDQSSSLKFRSSYDGNKWGDYATLTSASHFDLEDCQPYYLELKAFGGSVNLKSFSVSYACAENANAQVPSGYTWKLVTENSEIEYNNEYVLAALNYDYAMSKTQNANNRGSTQITKNSNGTININDNVEILTLVKGNNNSDYSFKTNANQYLNADSNSRLTSKTSINQYTTFDVHIWEYENPSEAVLGDLHVRCTSSGNKNYVLFDSQEKTFICSDSYKNAKEVAIYKKTQAEVGIPLYNTKISATDETANSYKLGDIFDNKVGTSSGMNVKLHKSNGTTAVLSKGDYSYTLKNLSGTTISPTTGFTSSGSYIIEITYGYLTFSYQINVAMNAVEEITLNKTSLRLEPNNSETLTATVFPSNATNKNVLWESDNDAVATVNNGVVTAVSDGEATIIAKSESNPTVTATCSVKVRTSGSASDTYTLVTGVNDLVGGDYYVLAGTSHNYTAGTMKTTTGKNPSSYFQVFESTFSDDYSEISSLNESTIEMELEVSGDYYKFKDSSGKYLDWSSTKYIFFSEQGSTWSINFDANKTAVDGNAIISSTKASSNDRILFNCNKGQERFTSYTSDLGSFMLLPSLYHKASVKIQVDVDGVSLNKQSITLAPSESETLTATVSPANASNKSVTWESFDSNVATVDSTGHVTAVAEGNTTIVVKTVDGGFTATCEVIVQNKEVTSLTVDPSSYTLTLGDTYVLHAITNEDATIQTVTWSSDNQAIVKVDSDGTIYGISEGGPVNVTATANNGMTASCAVTVSASSGGGGGGGGETSIECTIDTSDYKACDFTTSDGNFTLGAEKNGGQSDPTYNTKDDDYRLYAKNKLTITSNCGDMTTLVFNISSQGLKRWATVTVNTGELTVDVTAKTLTWTGTASSVTFTVGAKADYGTDSNGAGQLDFTTINVVVGSGGSGGGGGGDTPPTPSVVLSSIAVSGQKTSFAVGDTFSFGGTVTATYSNFDTADVTSSAEFSGYNMSSASSQTVQVSYTENGVTQTTTYSITVNPRPATLLSISVSGQKTEFSVGDSFVFGGIVTANFDDGTSENVTENARFSGYSLASAGTSTVTVTYNGKTTTYPISVKSSQGDVPSGDEYQITFTADSDSSTACTTATLRDIISSGSANISSVASVDRVYPGEKGAKFGSSKGGGNLSLNLSSSIAENETVYIKLDVAQYSTEAGSISISVNGEASARLTVDASSSTSGLYTFSPTLLVSSIKITSVKRVYLKGITISTKPLEPVNPTSITVSPNSLEMTKGDASKLSVSYLPTNANQNKEITWTSSNTDVAVISSDGTVTAKANGNSTITAKSKLGLTSTCSVVVKDITVTSISVNPTSATISNGSTKQLTATINPSNATNKGVTWTSSNSSVASVDTNGLVTAKSVGNTTITATALGDTTKKATCNVEVVAPQSDAWTIMIYMCGADLESESGLASGDIDEMLKVSGQTDKTNIIIQTGGANSWEKHGISASANQRYHIENRQLVCDNSKVYSSYKSMGQSSTFADFVTWGLSEYPAEKTGVILWNHGGAMRGVCYDEKSNDDALLNSEVKSGLSTAFSNVGRSTSNKLEWIGYDACLMQAQDIAEFNSQYFNYMIASQESEAGYGWDYDNWLGYVYNYNTYSTEQVLSRICDTFISDNGGVSSRNGDQTLSWLNLAYMSEYKTAWESFASALKTKFGNKVSKNDFYTFMHNNVKYFGGEDDDDEYFGMFDVMDFLNKIEANSNYNPGGSYISNVKTAFNKLVKYSVVQKGAGNANGLCCIYSKTSGNWLLGNNYSTSQTNFANWRSFVSTYGQIS